MAAEISWIKIKTDIFQDDKIRLIRSLPEGRTMNLIWFQLLTQAGRNNEGGLLRFNDTTAYTTKTLSIFFDESEAVIQMALQTFQSLGLINLDEQGFIWIENWEKHQNVAAMDKVREQARLRKQRERERKKAALMPPPKQEVTDVTRDSHATVTPSHEGVTPIVTPSHATELELEREKEELEKDIKELSRDLDEIAEILAFLNKRANRAFGNNQANRKEIQSRVTRGAKIEQCKLVIDWKVSEWLNDAKMKKHLNPVTLFRAQNFDRYLDEAKEELTNRGENVERILSGYREDQANSPFAAQAEGGKGNAKDRGRDGQRSKATSGHSEESKRIAEIAKRDGYLSDSLHDPEYDF